MSANGIAPIGRRMRVLVSSVSSDAHMWNLVFLRLLLEELGHDVTNVGVCAPDDLVIAESLRVRPQLILISTVNGHGHLDGARLVRKLRALPELSETRMVIGGKLGVRGADNVLYGQSLIEAGFDSVFEADAGLNPLEYLRAVLRAPSVNRAPASAIPA
jgi:Methylmalonyl-CoA mutase, C-terminal domain/subunit (cobalamin-binding)